MTTQDIPDFNSESQPFVDVLDTLQDSYFEANKTGIVTYANRAFYENLQLSRRDEVIGRHFSRFTDRESVRPLTAEFRKLYDGTRIVPRFEYYYRRADGVRRPGEISISPIVVEGKVVGSRGIIRDISDRISLEEELREAKESAEARAGELSSVNRVAQAVTQTLDLPSVLQVICEELTSIFPVRNAGVGLLTPDGRNLEVVAFHTPDPNEKSALGIVIPLKGNKASQDVIRKRRTTVIQDAQSDPRSASISELSQQRGTRSLMIVPIMTRGEAIGTVGMPAVDPYHVFTGAEIALAETIAGQIATAVDNARMHTRTESALNVAERDLEIGKQIQSGFFPESFPLLEGWELAAHFTPARQVAGDFYDVFKLKNASYTAVVIADVCDKGVGAALFMVLFRSLIRAFSESVVDTRAAEPQLVSLLANTNRYIAEYHGRSNMFATLFVGLLNHETGELHYVNGGHEPPVVVDQKGRACARLMPTGPAVGMFPELNFTVNTYLLKHGDCLVGFTDGATDAMSPSGALFTEDRLLKSVCFPWTSVFSMLFELHAELQDHISERLQFDDITLIALRHSLPGKHPVHAICRPSESLHIPAIRRFVELAASHEGLQAEQVEALMSASDEVVTNIIQHGYEGRKPGVLSIGLEVIGREVARVTIVDDGAHFSPDQAPVPELSADWTEREQGGLGISWQEPRWTPTATVGWVTRQIRRSLNSISAHQPKGASNRMEISNRNENGLTVVSPVGSIDAVTAPELAQHLQDLVGQGQVRLVVDMKGVDYTSSAGLRVFLGMVKETRAAGGDVRLASTQPAVHKVLNLSGFTSILRIFDDTAAAVASFAE